MEGNKWASNKERLIRLDSGKDFVVEGFMKPLQSANFVFTGQRYDPIRAQKSISNSQHIGERK
jgi:hypothetical protein